MIGQRASDVGSPGFRSFVILVLAAVVVAAWFTWMPEQKIAPPKPIDACRNGIVHQYDGKDWHPVTIPRQSRYYDGKKWAPDHEAGHVRTIPCGDEK